MDFEAQMLPPQRWLVLAVIVGTGLVFSTSALDAVMLPKVTVVLVGVGLLGVVGAARVAATGKLALPTGPFVYASAAVLVALLLATFVSGRPAVSLLGSHGRFGGLVLYGGCVVLALAVLRLFDEATARHLVAAMLVTAGVIVLYGLVQAADVDPVPWSEEYGDSVFSTLGNPNFAAGYLGITTPLALWGALAAGIDRRLRILCGVLTLGAVAVTILTDSLQGLVGIGAGVAVLALAVIRSRGGRLASIGTRVWLAAGGLSFTVAAAGLAGFGPLSLLHAERNFELRRFYWRTAVAMFSANPVFGVGLDRYGSHYHEYRPVRIAVQSDISQTNDAAHNVVLDMLAEGGILLGLSYLALVVVTGWFLVQGLRRLEGERLVFLGAVGGGWTAYQVQALVSIDVPPLVVLHWVLAALVVLLAGGAPLRHVTLPWAPRVVRRTSGKGKGRSRQRVASISATRRGWVLAGAGLAGLIVLWTATVPLRADVAARHANRLLASGEAAAAVDEVSSATDLAGWAPTYWFERGRVLASAGQGPAALSAFETAASREPRALAPAVTAARLAARLSRPDVADRWYRRALSIDPQHPDLRLEVARFHLDHDQPAKAIEVLEEAVDRVWWQADLWTVLGRAYEEGQDVDAARRAYEEALAAEPGYRDARVALRELSQS